MFFFLLYLENLKNLFFACLFSLSCFSLYLISTTTSFIFSFVFYFFSFFISFSFFLFLFALWTFFVYMFFLLDVWRIRFFYFLTTTEGKRERERKKYNNEIKNNIHRETRCATYEEIKERFFFFSRVFLELRNVFSCCCQIINIFILFLMDDGDFRSFSLFIIIVNMKRNKYYIVDILLRV